MAFKGKESTESVQIKRYTGVASVVVKGVNPTKQQLDEFFGRESENEPSYVSTVEVNGNKVPQVRIDFLVATTPKDYVDAEGNSIDFKQRVTFFLRREARLSSAGKYQVIDKYGRTAWVTPEDIEAKRVPVYSNGKPANICPDYRKAYSGEEELIKFLIAYLNIPSPMKYVNGEWVMKSAAELDDCEAMLEHIEDYFKGDFKELQTLAALLPNNKVKVLFGIRNTDDGKQYQSAYTRMFLKNSTSDYSKLDKDVMDTQNAGAYPNTVFECSDLHEFVVVPTNLETFAIEQAGKTPWD